MKTQEQIEKLKTLQESLDSLSNTYKELTKSSGNVVLSDVAEGKKQIADAIKTKGGSASADSSFSKLAEDIQTLPYAGISAEGIVQAAPFEFLSCLFEGDFPVVKIKDTKTKTINFTLLYFPLLKEAEFDELEKIETTYFMKTGETLVTPKLKSYQAFVAPQSAINIVFGTLEFAPTVTYVKADFLRNITIGQSTNTDLSFQTWTATNVITEGQSGIDELNTNLYNNLLTKLYDHSEDGQTRTLRLGWLAHVTQENIDYANSKGWTLTT